MVPLDWSNSYLCRVQMLSLFWTLPETLFPTYCLLPFRVKKIGIMIPPLRSGYYQSFFTSLPTHSPIIEFSHVLIYCLDNLQSSVCLGKYGIMTMSSRGGYRLFLNLVNPSASSVEQLFKISDALFARAAYDHLVVEDFAKPAFMLIYYTFKLSDATGQQLLDRHIAIDASCCRCGEPETILHMLFHCQFAQLVWSPAPFARHWASVGAGSVREGLITGCKLACLPPTGIASGPLAPWICWSLWKSRNQKVFSTRFFTPEETLLKAITNAKEWLAVQGKSPDGSWRNDLKAAGLGWTFTNLAGLTSHHSALCENVSSPFMAESLACGAVVLEAVKAGADSFLLESDYQQLVVAINALLVLLEVHGIISYIFLSIGRFSHFLCRFIPRSTNLVADSLAKQCLSLYGQNIC
ncbi:putative ribonuclease H domain, reverse transcriptase zinc-binding domain-containing protein [Arabidopsis thaliana]